MAAANFLYISCIILIFRVLALITQGHAAIEERKVYIVYMGNLDEREQSPSSRHINMLQEVVDIEFARKSLIISYTRSFNGFAANLTAREHKKLAKHKSVVSIFPSTTLHPQTTRSWDFMGFPESVHRNPTVESDIIIGVIDSGIWPESKSFSDKGFSPPPKKWKGACKGGANFTCNNKLIGARRYYAPSTEDEPDMTARDPIGHGSHTASIAAGNNVKDVSFYGIAKGTARGGVPSARIAAYKVCSGNGCDAHSILAAFDDAIADGVDIITISIGTRAAHPLNENSIAIGSLHATLKGILVVQSAGNTGLRGTVSSTSPWIFTVGASTTDRGIVSKVALGNGTILLGKAVNTFKMNGTSFPLIYGKDIPSTCDESDARHCVAECVETSFVKGKIVLCDTSFGIGPIFTTGAAGVIVYNDNIVNVSTIVEHPCSALDEHDFSVTESYIKMTEAPKADILTSETIRNLDAPQVANSSSRGPNVIIPDILKPDVVAPGIEILAAFSPKVALPGTRFVNYSILSGTSMACPHVAGAAAYVKSLHPDWSPSTIKSALMTTAWKMNATNDPDLEFSYGSGHIDPIKAADPGLVYETLPEDIAEMVCTLVNDASAIKQIFGGNCSGRGTPPKDMNYPSITIRTTTNKITASTTFSHNFTRTVMNVGLANSTYRATTSKSSEYNISVNPNILSFRSLNEKKTFEVIINGRISDHQLISASLEWFDGFHNVRSPIVVYPDTFPLYRSIN